jgi:hypothetical protein
MIPLEVTLAHIADEMPPAHRWAAANGWELLFDEEALLLEAATVHPGDLEPLLLLAGLDSYRALPPSWCFVDPETRVATARATPSRDEVNGKASVIYGVGVICAHFSRTAYKDYNPEAPHGDWGGMLRWDSVTEGVQAHVLAEMIGVIDQHLRHSKGRLG